MAHGVTLLYMHQPLFARLSRDTATDMQSVNSSHAVAFKRICNHHGTCHYHVHSVLY